MTFDIETLHFTKSGGTVTVITIDDATGRVLMVAHADRDALEMTMRTGEMHYRSRTRGLWRKGETSGNLQRVVSLAADCDGDSVIARVVQSGPACHTGAASCFESSATGVLGRLDGTIVSRAVVAGEAGYTRRLLEDRNLRLKKLGEETAELVTAAADGDAIRATEEAADLLYHMMVVLRSLGAGIEDVQRILAERERPAQSGYEGGAQSAS